MRWASVTKVVKDLISDRRVFVFSQLEKSFPEFRDVVLHSAWAHLLHRFEPHLSIWAFGDVNYFIHVFSVFDGAQKFVDFGLCELWLRVVFVFGLFVLLLFR